MKIETKPQLIILDLDLELAVKMLTEDDLRRQITNCYNLLLRVYFKQYGLCNSNVWKYVVENKHDILYKALPDWPLTNYPKKPPKTKLIEFKFVKLCLNNYKFVLDYGLMLCSEFFRRYKKRHVKFQIFDWISNHLPNLAHATNYTPQYPILSIPIKFRKKDYITSARLLYKSLIENPMDAYKKVDVPDFFNIKDLT